MKKIAYILLGLFLFIAGCTKKEPELIEDTQGRELEEIEVLKGKISELEKQIVETREEQEILEQVIMSHDGLGYGELRRSQQMLEDLIRHLPNLEIRTGFIQKIENGTIGIDFAEKVESA